MHISLRVMIVCVCMCALTCMLVFSAQILNCIRICFLNLKNAHFVRLHASPIRNVRQFSIIFMYNIPFVLALFFSNKLHSFHSHSCKQKWSFGRWMSADTRSAQSFVNFECLFVCWLIWGRKGKNPQITQQQPQPQQNSSNRNREWDVYGSQLHLLHDLLII